ncbi:MAG: DUF4331 domain-containing protein [Gammaproteobacteria bacterium]
MRRSAQFLALAAASVPLFSLASSHREAPFITNLPKVDGTDLYLFRSYEPGRSDYVTVIANYLPLQDPTGGPNFFRLDPLAVYRINIDGDGDAVADLTFSFRFSEINKKLAVPANGVSVPVPVLNIGQVDAKGAALNVEESYTVWLARKYPHGAENFQLSNAATGARSFAKPVDNIGMKSIPDYAAYASQFIHEVTIPGCPIPGRMFVGQRKEGFVINVGEIFDLVNTNPVGPREAEANDLSRKNVTSLALEIPLSCITKGKEPVVGAWTTASVPSTLTFLPRPGANGQVVRGSSSLVQVSRLGNPLVNEIIIGLPDKDKFNGSRPTDDAQFLKYVTNPTLPVLLNVLYGDAAKVPASPRSDLVAAFLTGVKGVNQPAKVTPAELMRLNTSVPPTAPADQKDLGVLAGDSAGFPNGRRPFDDVADIELRVAEGALCGKIGNCGTQTVDPNNGAPYTDGTRAAGPDAAHLDVSSAVDSKDTYLTTFPYLNTPLPGSPNATE